MTHRLTRSLLFVPATRPDRITKALASEADLVIVDLEDAVATEDKTLARQLLDDFLSATPEARLLVRINAVDSANFIDDMRVCRRHDSVVGVMLPKAESADKVALVHTESGRLVWPLIETAEGLSGLADIAQAPGVERLCIGALDLAADLRIEPGTPGAEKLLDQCRCQLVVTSRAAGLPAPIESVVPDIDDLTYVGRVARQAAEMGFAGMLCIHPRQLVAVHRAFTPDTEQLAWARRVLSGAEVEGGVFRLDGQMVDAPVIDRARSILERGRDA